MAATFSLTTGMVYVRGIGDGSKASPGFPFTSEPSSGWYRAAAGDIRLSVLNTDRIVADPTFSSLVGPDGGAYLRVANSNVQVNSATLTLANGGTARSVIAADAANTIVFFAANGTAQPTMVRFGPATNGASAFRMGGANLELVLGDQSAYGALTLSAIGFGSPGSGFVQCLTPGVIKFRKADLGISLAIQVNAAPTCTANCGTSPSVAGSDSAGIITMGATGVPASGFVLTFGTTWAAAPSCTVASALTGMVAGKDSIVVSTTTTTMTVTTNGTAPSNSDKYSYLCFGVA